MSKYRLMENNGLYKIEEYKRVGFLFKRYKWVQETRTQILKDGVVAYEHPVSYNNRETALQRLEELRLKEIRTSDEWKEVKAY